MTNGFGVTPEELRSHASKLQGLGDELGTALDAARQVSMSSEAYGVLCSFFVPIVQTVSEPGVDGLRAAEESMHETAAQINDTAATYESGDTANASAFGKLA